MDGASATTNGHANGNGVAVARKYGDMRDYMAPSLMQPHNARQAIRDAHEKKIPPILGYYAGLNSVNMMRFLSPMGYDAVWIDWEHSPMDVETMTTLVHETMFMSGGKTIPWVRVPGHDHAAIGYAMDAGASIVVPQVETVAQAQHVVSSAKFGRKAKGTRSVPPARLFMGLNDQPAIPGLDLHRSWNETAALMIQIESLQAIHNLDAILTEVPDIDVVWLGSLDARVNMDLPSGFGLAQDEPEWLEAVKLFRATLKKHNKPYSGFSFATGAQLAKDAGEMCMCFVAFDIISLMPMYQTLVASRQAVALKK